MILSSSGKSCIDAIVELLGGYGIYSISILLYFIVYNIIKIKFTNILKKTKNISFFINFFYCSFYNFFCN